MKGKWDGCGWFFAGVAMHVMALAAYGWGLWAAVSSLGERPVSINVKVLPDGHRQPELFIVPEK